MDRRRFMKAAPVAAAVAAIGATITKPSVAQEGGLKLADECKPDVIRLWKLGSLEHNIFPTDHAVQQLADILSNREPGGILDLIWGPDMTCEVITTDGKTAADVVNIGKPTPEEIANKVMEKLYKVKPEECGDLRKQQRSDIMDAVKEACQEAVNAQNA